MNPHTQASGFLACELGVATNYVSLKGTMPENVTAHETRVREASKKAAGGALVLNARRGVDACS